MVCAVKLQIFLIIFYKWLMNTGWIIYKHYLDGHLQAATDVCMPYIS